MIGKLKGTIEEVGEDHVLVDVHGVCYVVYCSSQTLAGLGSVGEAVTLQIWDVNSQTLLTSAAARTHGNSWQYYDVPDVALANGGTYVVGILAQNNSANYFFQSGLGNEWYPTGVINYNTMRFNGGDGSFPTLTLDGYHYGVVDLGYTIPSPASAALLAMGGIAAVRRRRA